MKLRDIPELVSDTADKLSATAENTRVALVAVAVLGVVALAVGLIALGIAVKARTA